LQDFQDLLQVSRNTVIDDIKTLKNELNHSDVELQAEGKMGYIIRGSEIVIRNCFIHYLTEVIPQETLYSYLKSSKNYTEQQNDSLRPYQILSANDITIIKKCLDERSEEHTSELQSRFDLVCRLLLEKK